MLRHHVPASFSVLTCCLALVAGAASSRASNLLELPEDEGRSPKITGLWYLAYVHEQASTDPEEPEGTPDINRFEVQRGYLTYRTKITRAVSARITSDISVDQEGDGLGDIELRLKYGYVEIATGDLGVIRRGRFRGGVLQSPWIDFEQEINDFRVQGQMFLEHFRVLSSADYGVGFFADLGEPLGEEFRTNTDRRHAARWGSFAVGAYNGGGYDQIEQNDHLVAQSRLTLRPLPDALPGLQVHAGFATGHANTSEAQEYRSVALMLSHEARWGVLTLTGYDGIGDLVANIVDDEGESLEQRGASIFGELRFLKAFSVLGRFDLLRYEWPDGDRDTEKWYAALAWRCFPGAQLFVDYEDQKAMGGPAVREIEQMKAALELRF